MGAGKYLGRGRLKRELVWHAYACKQQLWSDHGARQGLGWAGGKAMRNPNGVTRSLRFATIGAWLLVAARILFGAFPGGMSTPSMVLFSAGLTAITSGAFWLKRTAGPGKRASFPARIAVGVLLCLMAAGLDKFAGSHPGKSGYTAILMTGSLCLAAVFALQWFADRSQF